MTYALIAYAIAQLADVWTTLRGLKRGATEANGLMAWMMQTFGKGWIVIKLGATGALAYLMFTTDNMIGLWLVAGITAAVAYRNYEIAG